MSLSPRRHSTMMLVALLGACGPAVPDSDLADSTGPGVPIALARQRAAVIDDLRYDVSLSIPADRASPITGSLNATFVLAPDSGPVVLDFAQPADHVLAVRANGAPAGHVVRDEHIVLAADALGEGRQQVAVDFVAGDGSLNRGDEFLYTLFVPDRARVALPVFDQPDLKARVTLTLEVPAGWQAMANGALTDHAVSGDRATFVFRESDPLPTYLIAFAAGRFELVESERDGRTFQMLHRETDDDAVQRNREAIFDLHATALSWLEKYTGIAYPFQTFGFVAVPAFQYGGMEHPGAIFYRARSLFLDESATQAQQLGRASLIAHETAHMWFGNLVTMAWFDDVWMKEVFANFMAAKIVNPSFPDVDHDLRFLHAHHPAAYGIDRTPGANPIRQDLDNLREAGTLYGAIIYQKAPIVMKHLERLMGEEPFRDGLREYLAAHRYGNATWPDLIEVMDARTDEDLAAWSRIWVHEAGRPTIDVRLDAGRSTRATTPGASEIVRRLVVTQTDPFDRGRRWNQHLEVVLGWRDGAVQRFPVQLRNAEVEVGGAVGAPAPDYVLVNGGGLGYGNFALDDGSRDVLLELLPSLPDSTLRAVAMLSLYDTMLEGRADPAIVAHTALRSAIADQDDLNAQRFLSTFEDVWWGYLDPARHLSAIWPGTDASAASIAETMLWTRLERADEVRQKAAFFNTYRDVARTPEAIARLHAIWSGDRPVEGLPLSENDRTSLAEALAVRGVPDADAILDAQLARIENPDRRARLEFIRPALSSDPAVRRAFFDRLRTPANREREPWVLAALGHLHHPLRAADSQVYIRPSLELLEEIQRTGDIFFPLGWLSRTLDGHSSPGAAAVVETFLTDRPDLPPRLRGKLLQAADPLFRAARIIHGGAQR